MTSYLTQKLTLAMSIESILLYTSILAVIGLALSKAGFRIGIPSLLLFLGVGMLAGYTGYVEFNSAEEAQTIGIIALTMILFTGGKDTDFREVKPVIVRGTLLATVGVLLTMLLTGTFIYFLFRQPWINKGVSQLSFPMALLCAAVMSSTDSASVFSILRSKDMHLKHQVKPLLEFESGSNDPMAYMLTLILLEMVQLGEMSIWAAVETFLIQFTVGGLLGYLLGKGAVWFVNKMELGAPSLNSILLLFIAFFIYSATTRIGGNGYLAVYLSGLVIGNSDVVYKKSAKRFFDGFQWLCQLVMFLSLGLLVNVPELADVALPAILIGLFLMFLGRPIAVMLTMLPFIKKMPLNAMCYTCWVGLRGAVPIIFATYPLVADVSEARMIFNIVFFITLVSLTVQGSTVSVVAKWFGLVDDKVRPLVFKDVDLPENFTSTISEMVVSQRMIEESNLLRDINIPSNTLAILVKRGDSYFVPRGETPLEVGDHVLVLSDDEDALIEAYEQLGVHHYHVGS